MIYIYIYEKLSSTVNTGELLSPIDRFCSLKKTATTNSNLIPIFNNVINDININIFDNCFKIVFHNLFVNPFIISCNIFYTQTKMSI